MGKYTHGRTCVYNLNYHIVWCVKYRKKVITEDIASRLYEVCKSVAQEKGFEVITIKTGEMDHVHCFVSAPPKMSVTQVVKYLKGVSGRILLHEFPELRAKLWHGELWNCSYFAESIGSSSEENIARYIERQKVCQH
jgi:putative transposase